MEKEIIFVDGLVYKEPRQNAPEYIKGSLAIKVDDFIVFLTKHNNRGWVNIDLKLSRKGNIYAELNQWQPKKETKAVDVVDEEEIDLEGIPF